MKKKSKIIIRIILAAAAATFTLLYIGPVITTGQINIGLLTGFALACAALIYAAFFDKINAVLCKITANKAGKIITGAISAVLACCIIASGAAFGCVLYGSTKSAIKHGYSARLQGKRRKPGTFFTQQNKCGL